MHLPTDCPCCSSGVESLIHLLRDCPYAQSVWNHSSLAHLYNSEATTVQDWFQRVVRSTTKQEFAHFVVFSWNLWYARNRKVWHSEVLSPQNIVERSHKYIKHFWQITAKKRSSSQRPSMPPRQGKWSPPEPTWLKVNVDGSTFTELNATGMGVVVRNAQGEVKYARSGTFPGYTGSLLAELRALLGALRWLRSMSLDKLVVETDSESAVKLLAQERVSRCDEAGVLARSCKFFLERFREVKVQHVLRDGNKVANELARIAPTLEGEKIWMGVTPSHVVALVQADNRS